MDTELDMVPPAADRERALRVDARGLLRGWLTADDADVLRSVDRIGGDAMRAAGEASVRLDRGGSSTETAQAALRDLQALAERLDPPTANRRWWPFGGDDHAPAPPDVDALVERLQRERDGAARALLTLETDLGKLRRADDALQEVVHVLRATEHAVDAAAREIAIDRPDRAAFFRGALADRLTERRRDVLTQLAVARQGVLALALLLGGQEALVRALDRAHQTSIAALRTALAARRAVVEGRTLTQRADALARVADASRDPADRRADARLALGEAVDQVRRAIDAVDRPPLDRRAR